VADDSFEQDPEQDQEERSNDDNRSNQQEKGRYDLRELVELRDGFQLYKRKKLPASQVRGYCWLLDQDYNLNKVTVCAHMHNLMNFIGSNKGCLAMRMCIG